MIVQIAKEPIAKKGARITSHTWYFPDVTWSSCRPFPRRRLAQDSSRDSERLRLKKDRPGHQGSRRRPAGGFIARTAAIGQPDDEWLRDMRLLLDDVGPNILGKIVRTRAQESSDHDPPRPGPRAAKVLRDQLSDDFVAIRVDNEMEYQRGSWISSSIAYKPKLTFARETVHEGRANPGGVRGSGGDRQGGQAPRVWLKSGGSS